MQTSDYYVQQVLKTSGNENQYHRIQLSFDDPAAPEAICAELARGKVLGLDVRDKRLLRAMHTFAKQYYHEHEMDILSFLKLTDRLAPA